MLSKRLAAVDIIYCHFEKSTGTNVAVIAVLLYRCLFFSRIQSAEQAPLWLTTQIWLLLFIEQFLIARQTNGRRPILSVRLSNAGIVFKRIDTLWTF